MVVPTLQELLEAGIHFGHHPSRWNPSMAPYIFGTRGRVHIIDLQQTLAALEKACSFLQGAAAAGKVVLFVGTKRQARPIVKQEAERCGMPYVTTRWLGGTLTNFPTILRSIEKRSSLAEKLASAEVAHLTKKDQQKMRKEITRLDTVLEGLRNVRSLPDVVVLAGAHEEKLAVREARRTGVPIVAIVDTNADPAGVDYVIPANDDAVRSLTLIIRTLANAVMEGKQQIVAPSPVASSPPPPESRPEVSTASPVPAGETSAIL